MFVLLVLVGCLTEEVFEDEYGEALCVGVEACGAELSPCPDPPSITTMECTSWDAAGAQACLDALETSCGETPPECEDWPFCGQ